MLVIAHRGANKEALENSWQAYEAAIASSSHRIELDVHLTKDGHVAINHDLDLSHTAGVHANIAHLTRAELEKIKLLNGDPIPFLDQVLQRFASKIEFNIEIKGDSTVLAEAVASHISKYGRAESTIVSSFCHEPLVHLFERHPHILRACLWGDRPRWPMFSFHSPLVMMQECRADIFHPFVEWLNEDIMDQARSRGWKVFPWVSMKGEEGDKQALWGWLHSLGIDGLCTNYPRQLAIWLSDLKQETKKYEVVA